MTTAIMGRSALYFPTLTELFLSVAISLSTLFKKDDKPPKEPVGAGEVVSLDELKARTKAQEEADKAAEGDSDEDEDSDEDPDEDEPDEDEEDEPDEDEPDEDEDEDQDEEEGRDKGKKAKVEDWMLDEEGTPPDEKKFSDSDAAAIRRKYKGKLSEKDEALAEAQARIKELEQGGAKKPDTSDLHEPKREDFKDTEDYLVARQDYFRELDKRESQTSRQAETLKQERQQQKAKISKAVDDHYERAHELSVASGINPDKYKAADTAVRAALEAKFPEAGDDITESLIARMGPGSEKVIFNLGVNRKRLEALIDKFDEDRTGLAAAIYLGELNAKLTSPPTPQSRAPKPAPKVGGDKKADASKGRQFKKQYQDAHKSQRGQEAFEIKRKAKAAGVDVSDW